MTQEGTRKKQEENSRKNTKQIEKQKTRENKR